MKKVSGIYEVAADTTLMPFLAENLQGVSRNKLKSLLAHRQVKVNRQVETRFDTPLVAGDRVEVISGRGSEAFRHPMMRIVYEDEAIIVIDKRNGLLSVGTDKERTKTAFYLLSEHVKKEDPRNRIFIIHRLDRETSGLMMFAKSEEVQSAMQRDWNRMVRDRRYVAVVEGRMPDAEGVIDAALSENKNFKVYVDPESGERAVTRYSVMAEGAEYSLVELMLETGKKNQIRAHLEHVGHPVSGDRKYGAGISPAGRVCLHARVLNIIHPVTGEEMDFSTHVPMLFEQTVGGRVTSDAPFGRSFQRGGAGGRRNAQASGRPFGGGGRKPAGAGGGAGRDAGHGGVAGSGRGAVHGAKGVRKSADGAPPKRSGRPKKGGDK